MSANFTARASVNLLPAHRWSALRTRRRTRAWIVLVAVYGAGLGAAWGCWGLGRSLGAASSESSREGTTADQASAAAAQIEKLRTERTDISTEIVEAQHRLDAAKSVGHHPDWSVLLDLLAGMNAPANTTTVFERVELQARPAQPGAARGAKAKPGPTPPQPSDTPDADGYLLVLEGVAATQIDVVRLASGLEGLKLFESVAIVGTHPRDSVAPDAAGPHLVSFQINCTLSDAAAAVHIGPSAPARKQPAKRAPVKATPAENKP